MQLENLIRHFRDIQKDVESKDRVHVRHADFNGVTGFERVGIHHMVLPPGKRTSLPHAESLEEEFVFVISGRPDAWVDGWIHPLRPWDGVGFPAGSAIAHTILNNTNEDVELLVLGERTKKENQCVFPLHPGLKAEMGNFWWEVSPRRLGPHSGEPGKVGLHEITHERPPFIMNAMDIEGQTGWSYPGSTETFGVFHRFGDKIGLEKVAVSFERIPLGKRTSWPHVHAVEEEFAFILSGTAKVWLNGNVFEAGPGTGVAFPPNSGVAHCLINDGPEPVTFVMVGEPIEGDRINYPMHPSRNEEMRVRGTFLEFSAPLGAHDGRAMEA